MVYVPFDNKLMYYRYPKREGVNYEIAFVSEVVAHLKVFTTLLRRPWLFAGVKKRGNVKATFFSKVNTKVHYRIHDWLPSGQRSSISGHSKITKKGPHFLFLSMFYQPVYIHGKFFSFVLFFVRLFFQDTAHFHKMKSQSDISNSPQN